MTKLMDIFFFSFFSCDELHVTVAAVGMVSSMDPSSGMGPGEFGQMGDPTQFLTPNDLISQRSSPDFMPGMFCC